MERAPETPREPSAPPTGSYEDFTSEELVRVFDLRESEVPIRDLPGWAPPERVVVVLPEEWDRREERLAFLQPVAPGVELIPVRDWDDAVDRGVLATTRFRLPPSKPSTSILRIAISRFGGLPSPASPRPRSNTLISDPRRLALLFLDG